MQEILIGVYGLLSAQKTMGRLPCVAQYTLWEHTYCTGVSVPYRP